jgi:hypothetical protein
VLLFQDFEEACEGCFRDAQFFGEALKLLGGETLRLCDDNIALSTQMLGGKAAEFPPVYARGGDFGGGFSCGRRLVMFTSL